MSLPFHHNDGGRIAAGFTNANARDCVARAVAIASERPYREVYDALAHGNATERQTKRAHASSGKKTACHGIKVQRQWFRDYMTSLGFVWYSTMGIGTGCTVHLAAGELPPGRLVVKVSRHCCAVIDGVLNDLSDCARGGTRCVYGYWKLENKNA